MDCGLILYSRASVKLAIKILRRKIKLAKIQDFNLVHQLKQLLDIFEKRLATNNFYFSKIFIQYYLSFRKPVKLQVVKLQGENNNMWKLNPEVLEKFTSLPF